MIELALYAAVCVLGITRITLAIAVDHIGVYVRNQFSPDSFIGELISCTDCLSFWVALVTWVAFLVSPEVTAILMLPWAMAMVAALIARRY